MLTWDTITTISAVAVFFGGSGWWLAGMFRRLEKGFYAQIDKTGAKILARMEDHERADDLRFEKVWTRDEATQLRVQKLELNAFGFTKSS